jgi:hypothetical protein
VEDFLDFIMEAMDTTEEEFCTSFPEPFLLVEMENVREGGLAGRPGYKKGGFADTIAGIPVGLERIKDDKICTLKKGEGRDPAEPIGVGRAPDNDIILDYPRVSKRHAVIPALEGTYFIQDAGSTNGTLVNDRTLEKGEKIELHNGDRIELGGDFVARFYTPSGLFSYINELADEMDRKGRTV